MLWVIQLTAFWWCIIDGTGENDATDASLTPTVNLNGSESLIHLLTPNLKVADDNKDDIDVHLLEILISHKYKNDVFPDLDIDGLEIKHGRATSS